MSPIPVPSIYPQYSRPNFHVDVDTKTYVDEPVVIRAHGTKKTELPEFPEHISTVPRVDPYAKPKKEAKKEQKTNSEPPVNFYIDPYYSEPH